MKTKVRVVRRDLIKVVQGRLRKMENDHKRAREAYPAKLTAWNESQAKRLDRMAAKARNGGLTSTDRHFRVEDAPILLSQEDADWYFGPCWL